MSEPSSNIIPAYLGWGNGERDAVGLRLYATDREPATGPRWDSNCVGGRVVEYAVTERFGQAEGDVFLVVRVGDRFTTDEVIERTSQAIVRALATSGDEHTIDVGFVHTLVEPGGECRADCPHPEHFGGNDE